MKKHRTRPPAKKPAVFFRYARQCDADVKRTMRSLGLSKAGLSRVALLTFVYGPQSKSARRGSV